MAEKEDDSAIPSAESTGFQPIQEGSDNVHREPAVLPILQPLTISPKDDKRASIAESVKSSVPSTTGGMTLSASISMSQTQESPQGSLSLRHRLPLKQFSMTDGQESSLNLSLLKVDSITSIHSDDSFHQPTHMVISPLNPLPQFHTSQTKIVAGRFSVSPFQNVPETISHKRATSDSVRTNTKSESSSAALSNRMSPEPDVQFQMSDLALHQYRNEEEQQQLLKEDPELVNMSKKGFSIEIKELDSVSLRTLEQCDFEDLINEVDENQRTVQSGYSVNTQDSAQYDNAPLMCGNISFVRESAELTEQKKHYVSVTNNTEMDVVSDFLRRFWGLKSPKIVLSVISNAEHYKPWKSQRLKDDFQKGIIKAANATSMWIVTNGIDAGVTKIIGDAVKEFNQEQHNTHLINSQDMSDVGKRKRKLPIIGITPKEMVPLSAYFDGPEGVQIRMDGGTMHREFYEFNPDHSHFIIVDDVPKDFQQDSIRCQIEKQFRVIQGTRKIKRLMSIGSEAGDQMINPSLENTIPVVGLLVQGTPNNIDHILFYLTNKMPVLVLKGTGGMADMIAYAYEEMQEKGDTDPDFEENCLKPELIKMISRMFPVYFEDLELEKFTLRDKIIQTVKLSTEVVDGDHSYLTVVNVKGWGSSMKDLDKFILTALFRIEKNEMLGLREQLQNDLQLTVDWNRPDLAWEIFQHDFVKVRIDKKMFEQALIQKDREDFIDLFLSQGVRVHSYLNPKKLKYLFERAEDREIFVNICLEGILGITVSPEHPLGDDFLTENLNRLMYKLSKVRHFFQPFKLYKNVEGVYLLDPMIAERKAINYLIIWAVIMNRQKLAKTLWNRCDEPIGVALVCSRMYKELSKYTLEEYRRTELEKNAKEFGEMALGALAICWRDSSLQAYHMFGKHLPDFNNKTVIEIAHDAGYIHFLAHPCCQKWLTKTFLGHLQIKELDWGLIRLPYWFKILVSVFFIFPMYIWITFIPIKKKKNYDNMDEEVNYNVADDSDETDDETEIGSKHGMDNLWKKPKTAVTKKIKNFLPRSPATGDVPFFHKLYLLWTAPITKFWNTQILYFTYLGIFCLATLWPVCGNRYIDVILWSWTAVIELELVCRVYIKYHKYKTLSLVGNCVDIFMIMLFLVVLLFTRILDVWVSFANYMQAKTFLCLFLIYFFYRLLGVYLPISPTLGPMLLRFNRMVKHDFVAFIRMFLIFMIAGGVTIQAIIYPNWPLNWELVKRVITRPIYGMFLTQVQDLEGDASCTSKYQRLTGYCATDQDHFYRGPQNTTSDDLVKELETCPYSSFFAYVITLQYLLICKLVLVTLLFAMFALTIQKVDMEASELWKFQRYALIADFIERFSLPPPFTVFSFVYLFLKFLNQKLKKCRNQCKNWCSNKIKERRTKRQRHKRIFDDTTFWKRVAREYVAIEQAKIEKENFASTQGEMLLRMQDDLRSHRKSMKRLNDKVIEVERMIQSSRLCLEDIQHKLEKTDVHVMGITDVKGKFIHVAARQSPYPGTAIARFPVFDKYVPLEYSDVYFDNIKGKNIDHILTGPNSFSFPSGLDLESLHNLVAYDVYDPKTFTLTKDNFLETEILYVDEDIIELNRKKEERLIMTEEEGKRLSPIPEFQPKWNVTIIYKEYGESREIDRRSWINVDNQPLRYTLDALGIPQNPLGRTGIRGKGNLWRWGPNHVIKAVVTRWRRKHSTVLNTMTDFLYVEGKRLLEFITVQKDTFMDSNFGLPGDVLHGYSAPYSILCESFLINVLDEPELAQKIGKFDQADMIQFFSQFASTLEGDGASMNSVFATEILFPSSTSRSSSYALQSYKSASKTSIRGDTDQQGFSASLLYKGYLDDPRNTDNAWVEAEVWNFHYDVGDSFDLRLKEESSVKWKEVSPYVKMFGNESVIVQEAARIHDAYH